MKRWPLHKAYFWETAPFFRMLLPFAVGILCYDRGWLNFLHPFALILIVFPAYAVTALIKKNNDLLRVVSFCLLNMLLFLFGSSSTYYSDIRNDKEWFGNRAGNNTYLARITDAPAEKEHTWKVPVAVIRAINDDKATPVTGNAFLYLYKDRSPVLLHKGDSLLIPGNWQTIKNAGNPFEFDYAAYCRRNNIYYQQVCSANNIRLYSTNNPAKATLTEKVHDWCLLQLDKYITDTKTKGLIQAMLLGDKVNLDEDLRQSYVDAGIVHIIAISGSHVAVFFMIISFLLWWIRHKQHLWIRYVVALPLVWFYVLMAGASPSAIRAAVMFSLFALSIMFDKNNNSLNTLFATAFVLLFAVPMWLFSAGFQLSFVAVLSLILFYKPVYKWVSPTNKLLRWLWGAVAASIGAEVLVAPLVIYYFHNFPVLFIIANVIACIFMTVVLILGMLVIAFSFIPAFAAFIGACTVAIVTAFDKVITWLQGFNPESFHYLSLSGVELLLLYLAIAGIVLYLLRQQKTALFAGLVAACVLLCSFCTDEWGRLHRQIFVVYNTGKANYAELIAGNSYKVVIADTGNKKLGYVMKPAHTGWQAWIKDTAAANDLFEINGKKVLVLNNQVNTDASFPIDYLVVNYTGAADVAQLQRIFSPSVIVVGNNYSQKQQEQWVRAGSGAPVAIHAIAANGSFVLK